MNISHLRTLLAIRQKGSLSAAADVVHLSHSAISVQMKQLEAELGAPLFVAGKRPATLTPLGEEVAREAREIVTRADNLSNIARADDTGGQVGLGFVPTTLETLLPVVLERLRARFPALQVTVRSGLSAELASDVEEGALDFAFLSGPLARADAVTLDEIGAEPLFLISAQDLPQPATMESILAQRPYIAFNRQTWLGRYIDHWLSQKGLGGEPAIELDSIDAIENLVARDFGVSVVPQRLMAPPLSDRLACLRLEDPAPVRQLMLAASLHCRRQTLRRMLRDIARQPVG